MCDKEKEARGGEGAAVKARELKQGAENKELCSLPLFIPEHSKMNASSRHLL